MRQGSCILAAIVLMASCEERQAPFDEQAALEHGGGIALAAFQQLSGRLQDAMQAGGPAHAVEYCSLAALPLLDSLSSAKGLRIRRTSDKIREPHDAPDADEQRRLGEVLDLLAKGTPGMRITSQVVLLGDSVAYYQPILINMPACLRCHGVPGRDIDSTTLAAIQQRYPGDAATGYGMGDLRGLWSIRWER